MTSKHTMEVRLTFEVTSYEEVETVLDEVRGTYPDTLAIHGLPEEWRERASWNL